VLGEHTNEGESETIVRYTRLPPALRRAEIFSADTLERIDPDWVTIIHAVTVRERRSDFVDRY
jgi:hypothetical protein